MHTNKQVRLCLRAAVVAGLCLALGLAHAGGAYAAPSFSVQPKDADDHMQAGRRYRLDTIPGQQQALALLVKNEGDEPLALSVEASDTFTSDLATIEYGNALTAMSGVPRFLDLTTVETPELVLGPGESACAMLSIAVPDEPFVGSILGGVRICESTSAQGADAQRTVPYLLDVQIDQAADSLTLQPALASIEGVRLSDSQTQVTFHITNASPVVLDPMALTIGVYADEEAAYPFYESHTSAGSMAPTSQMRYTRDIQLDLPAGEYWGKVCLVYAGESFEMAQPFSIRN